VVCGVWCGVWCVVWCGVWCVLWCVVCVWCGICVWCMMWCEERSMFRYQFWLFGVNRISFAVIKAILRGWVQVLFPNWSTRSPLLCFPSWYAQFKPQLLKGNLISPQRPCSPWTLEHLAASHVPKWSFEALEESTTTSIYSISKCRVNSVWLMMGLMFSV